jgi:HEAT repeat protein
MAAWALAQANATPTVVAGLKKAFMEDKSKDVRRTAVWAAGEIGEPSLVPALVGLLGDTEAHMREIAAWSIGSCEPESAPPALIKLLNDQDPNVRLSTVWALREIGDAAAADELEAAFNREKNPEVQHGLIQALGAMGDHAIETLSRLVTSPDPEVRAVAITALAGGNATSPWPRPEPRPFP